MAVPPEDVYRERCAEFRSLNTIFWQIPLIMMTLNGGLWFALGSLELTTAGQRLVLIFAAVANTVFAVALIRLRSVMGRLLAHIRLSEGDAKSRFSGTTVTGFVLLLGVAAAGALAASREPSAVLAKRPQAARSELASPETVVAPPPVAKR
jgi:hypothetical protein